MLSDVRGETALIRILQLRRVFARAFAVFALHRWGSASTVAHYASVSGDVTGPYERVSTAVGSFAHNPAVIAVPNSDPYLMFHIGIGCWSEDIPWHCNYTSMPQCVNGTTSLHPEHNPLPNPPNLTRAGTHVATSLDGPWEPVNSSWTLPRCGNNPAPLFLANGSFMMACHEPMAHGESNCPNSSLTYLATSITTDWRTGPYVYQCLNLTNHAYVHGNTTFTVASEDPHLYQDARGHLHMISHNQSPCYDGPAVAGWWGADVRGCGAHFFSNDGGNSWHFQWDHAVYNGTVMYADGVSMQYKRERPKLVQDAKGNLVALANGISLALVDRFLPGNDAACTLVVRVAAT